MIYDQEFIDSIDGNPLGSLVSICGNVVDSFERKSQEFNSGDLDELMETAALVWGILKKHQIKTENQLPEISNQLQDNCQLLINFLGNIEREFQGDVYELKFSAILEQYGTALEATFTYEFSQGDISRIQVLINELRERITDIDGMDESHRRRLLARLEKLQSELHKRVSDLDRFWGLVGDAGVVLGKFGTDAKPIVDRIRELAGIAWRTQARAEELPSGTEHPLIESADEK